MFWSTEILTKKGRLGLVWLASYEKSITRPQAEHSDIPGSCEEILKHNTVDSTEPFALRLSGQLLYGVCKLYHWKVHFYTKSSTASKITLKQACEHRYSQAVDLEKQGTAADVTLPEKLKVTLPLEGGLETILKMSKMHTARPEDITLPETENDNWISFDPNDQALLEQPEVLRAASKRDSAASYLALDDRDRLSQSMMRKSSFPDLDLPEVSRDDELFLPHADDELHVPMGDLPLPGDDVALPLPDDDFPLPEMSMELDAGDNGPLRTPMTTDRASRAPGSDGTFQSPGFSTPDIAMEIKNERVRKRRKLVVDEELELSDSVMKRHLAETSDIVRVVNGPGERQSWILALRPTETDQLSVPYVGSVAPGLPSLLRAKSQKSPVRTDHNIAAVGSPLPSPAPDVGLDQPVDLLPLPEDMSPRLPQPADDFFPDGGDIDTPFSKAVGDAEYDLPDNFDDVPASSEKDLKKSSDSIAPALAKEIEGWSDRTVKMACAVHGEFASSHSAEINFNEMVRRSRKRPTAARAFWEVLELATKGFVSIKQPTAFADISLKKTVKLDHLMEVPEVFSRTSAVAKINS